MALNVNPLTDSFALAWEHDPSFDRERETFERDWEVANETLDYSGVCKDGSKPTLFVFRPIPGPKVRRLLDLLGSELGPLHAEWAFRMALVRVENLGIEDAPKMERATDAEASQLGPVLKPEVVAFYDALAAAMGQPFGALVHSLGAAVVVRSLTGSPK